MGYITAITLNSVRVKKKCLAEMRNYLAAPPDEVSEFLFILENVRMDHAGNLSWIGEPAGKWYRTEEFVKWLSLYAASGTVEQRSKEGDGNAWAFKFNGRGGMRYFDLPPPPVEREFEVDSPIRQLRYDYEKAELLLEFSSGKVYRYDKVPRAVADEMAEDERPIDTFNDRIRGVCAGQPSEWPDE